MNTKATKPELQVVHYEDTFSITVNRAHLSFEEIQAAFIKTKGPWWIDFLFSIRDAVVGCFGISTRADHQRSKNSFGLFPILQRRPRELVLGEDEKHLNFRILLKLDSPVAGSYKLSFKTLVHFNNLLGRLYYIPVKPIHKLIVPGMLQRVAKNLPAEIR